MLKTPMHDKALKTDAITDKDSTIERAMEVDPMVKQCENMLKLDANQYAKARSAYLRAIKLTKPSLLKKVMQLLPK